MGEQGGLPVTHAYEQHWCEAGLGQGWPEPGDTRHPASPCENPFSPAQSLPMPTSPTLTEQLATLGVHLPAWPEEPEGGGATGDWIQRGQAYAEGVRLWRAQLRNAAAIEGSGGERLISTVQNIGRQSAWDQSVIRYLLSGLQGNSAYQRVLAAAALVAAADRTAAQRLGAALGLARDGFLVCGVDGIKQLVELQQVNERECLELCALLVANLQAASDSAEPGPSREGVRSWQQNVTLHLQATSMLATAASTASGEQNRAALVGELETLLTLAAEGRPGSDIDEREAIDQVKKRERRQQSLVHGKPLLRTIHHLACTGGTVISKCLAAMPDVALISEVNPFHRFGSTFDPTNPLLLLERNHRRLSTEELMEEFSRQIAHAYQICKDDDVDLIIRDHSSTDFCMGSAPSSICPVVDCLSSDYELMSVVTVRHPLDSYLALVAQGWADLMTPSSLDEYSLRYLAFLDRYTSLPILRYEDFCTQPKDFMERLCGTLEISYSACFLERFGAIILSGDSGRKGVDTIEPRPRREVPEQLNAEIESSESYSKLLSRLRY